MPLPLPLELMLPKPTLAPHIGTVVKEQDPYRHLGLLAREQLLGQGVLRQEPLRPQVAEAAQLRQRPVRRPRLELA